MEKLKLQFKVLIHFVQYDKLNVTQILTFDSFYCKYKKSLAGDSNLQP